MKKLLALFGVVMMVALISGPAYATGFGLDIDGDGSVDIPPGEITLSESETLAIDLYITDWPPPSPPPYSASVGSVLGWFEWDTGSIELDSFDCTDPGTWDLVTLTETAGKLELSLGSSAGAVPNVDGNVYMATVVIHCLAAGTDWVKVQTSDGGVIMDTGGLPYSAAPDLDVVVNQIPPPPCACDVTPDDPDTIIGVGSQQFVAAPVAGTDCDTPVTYEWESIGCLGGSVDGTGLFTADGSTLGETCTITATDQVNTATGVACSEDIVLAPAATCKMKIYRGGVCEEADPLDTIYNRPGRRGLAMTCCELEEICLCTDCDEADVPCLPEEYEWVVTTSAPMDYNLIIAPDGHSAMFDPIDCPDELIVVTITVTDCKLNVDSIDILVGKVAIGLGTTNAHPDTQTADVDLLLWNPENHVRAVQVDIGSCDMFACEGLGELACTDEEDALLCAWEEGACVHNDNMVCTECIVDEDRAAEFVCSANEQPDGTCRVVLYNTEPDDLIQQGSGAIARIKYDILGDLTSKDCICLWPFSINISDQFNEYLCGCPKAGEICFMICGDVYPQDCYECTSCGDGVVDLFDILEEIDFILGLQTATPCQMGHGDVPLGMPPYCGNPAGVNPPNCETDGQIDIFDALVIIDKALSRLNCCDYCMFGQIY